MITSETIPSSANPIVYVDGEFRSIYLPPHSYNEEMAEMNKDDRGGYGQAAVTIIAHGGGNGGYGVYWTLGQKLHLADGSVVASGLHQAADIIKHLGWANPDSINWKQIPDRTFQDELAKASQELGFS